VATATEVSARTRAQVFRVSYCSANASVTTACGWRACLASRHPLSAMRWRGALVVVGACRGPVEEVKTGLSPSPDLTPPSVQPAKGALRHLRCMMLARGALLRVRARGLRPI